MQSVSCQIMREIENSAFALGHSPESLMRQAGKRMAETLLRYYPCSRHAIAYLGKGHNAGDALVILMHLAQAGWRVELRLSTPLDQLAPLTGKMYDELRVSPLDAPPAVTNSTLLLDALLGIGAEGPLRPPLSDAAAEMNTLRQSFGCSTIAIDTPSGINADTGECYANSVLADHTLSIGFPKSGILTENALPQVGAISHITLDALTDQAPTTSPDNALSLITHQSLTRIKRPFDTHKGQAGRVGIWAGSAGMLGAAALCASAALKAGAGLVTLHLPSSLYPSITPLLPPEIMVALDTSPDSLLNKNYDAIVIGPGIGKPEPELEDALMDLISQTQIPMVIDADMLNVIARSQLLYNISKTAILTPHPGEMQRLMPTTTSREATAKLFSERYPCTLLYKGARTLVANADSPIFANSTGSPAMATAGQGDVLAGLISALCAQNYPPLEAAKTAAWLAGEAAMLALADGSESTETLTASSVISYLHHAFEAIPAKPPQPQSSANQ
ncbi:NAD(P)H-hydrate dehydratase [Rubritalea tangerina]|uniref:ADP-dependent (S)-NAD(P)H-hydrate dehydratase n=2 Tax=Rubritalea tangerina TaxID=430798 RepID=A0ABW4Z6T4_9BACT